MPNMTMQSDLAQYRVILILDCLSRGPITLKQLALEMSINVRWAKVYVDELRRLKAVRICKWFRNTNGKPYYFLELGSSPDKEAPINKTGAQKTEGWRKRKKASGEWDFVLAKQRAKKKADSVTKHQNSWLSSLI